MNTLTDADRLKLLMDYTKFHIGIYATIITVLLGLAVIGVDQSTIRVPEEYRYPILFVAVCLAVAGAFAGAVAAPIPNHGGGFDTYWNGPIRVLGREIHYLKVADAAAWEHRMFWLAVLSGLFFVISKGWPFGS